MRENKIFLSGHKPLSFKKTFYKYEEKRPLLSFFANKKSWLRNLFGSFFSKTKLPPIPALIQFFGAFLSLGQIFMIQLLMEPLAGCHLDIIVYKAEDFSSRPFSRHLCLLNNSRFFHGWKCSGCTQA